MIVGHCQGEDYSNPANELCGQALNSFNNVRTLDVYYMVNVNFYTVYEMEVLLILLSMGSPWFQR